MLRLRLLAAFAGAVIAGLSVATIAAARFDEDGPLAANRELTFGAGAFGPGCWQTHGGPFCTPFNYTVRLLGVRNGQAGSVWGEFQRRNHVTGGSLGGRITCMAVAGNRAAIGGFFTVTGTQPGFGVGDPFLFYVEDNGPIVATTPDRISSLAALPAGDPDLGFVPDAFPWVCPSADSIYGYMPLSSGDITVGDAAVRTDG